MRPTGVLAVVMCAIVTANVVAQTSSKAWTHPMTAWGDPDLSGMWPITHLNGTPVQRPADYGDRRFLSDKEFAQREAQLAATRERTASAWAEIGEPNRLTSLVSEPSNGQLPALTAEGRRRSATMTSTWSNILFDEFDDFNALDRCITRGLPASMFPFMYNSGMEIIQAPGYVVIRLEIVHETRVVPVDGRPPLRSGIRQWMGESRGRWEGNTLVVETTNFNGRTPMMIVGPGGNPIPTSESLRVVERFARTGAGTIDYEISVDDPVVLMQPWKAALPWKSDPEYYLFEYACHEGNHAIINVLRNSRFIESQRR